MIISGSGYLVLQVQRQWLSTPCMRHAPLKLPDEAQGWLLQVVKLAV